MESATMVKFTAEEAHHFFIDAEMIVGSTILHQARHCQIPVPGLFVTDHTTPGFDHVLKIGYQDLQE
jgi:hypothetical protein